MGYGQEETDDIISRDINRTFPEHPQFGYEQGQMALFRLLKAYSLHDLEVQYCQVNQVLPATSGPRHLCGFYILRVLNPHSQPHEATHVLAYAHYFRIRFVSGGFAGYDLICGICLIAGARWHPLWQSHRVYYGVCIGLATTGYKSWGIKHSSSGWACAQS
jgi:hypothetical protein